MTGGLSTDVGLNSRIVLDNLKNRSLLSTPSHSTYPKSPLPLSPEPGTSGEIERKKKHTYNNSMYSTCEVKT